MSMTRCPNCLTETTVDGDRPGVILMIALAQVAIFGGIAYLVLTWLFSSVVGVIAALVVAAPKLMNSMWAIGRGATTCHACSKTFTTR